MSAMTERQWETLEDALDTTRLLDAVDLLDRLRANAGLKTTDELSELREHFLAMHRMAMLAVGRRDVAALRDLFELAGELAGEDGERSGRPEAVQELLLEIVAMTPDGLSEDE
jgi:hypothetical protein